MKKDWIYIIVYGILLIFIISYSCNRIKQREDPNITYKNAIDQIDIKIDSINKLLKESHNDRKILYNKIDSINAIEKKDYEVFKRDYNNIVIGSISDDSITSYIASQIYNWQRYNDSIHIIRK